MDISSNTITRIRGNYIEITYNGINMRISKNAENCWCYKNADTMQKLENESIFKVGDKEFKIIQTEKRDGNFIIIPLITTLITISVILFQTYTLIKESDETNGINTDKVENGVPDTTIAQEPESAITSKEDFSSKNMENFQTEDDNPPNDDEIVEDIHSFVEKNDDMFKENIKVDWTSFQEGAKQRRNLLNNPSEMGIQVSKYQGDIEWEKVKADGIDYAIIQAGSRGYELGGLNEDPYFKKNMDGATANDIKIGVSFHSQAINHEEMDEEIELIIKSIQGYHLDYPIGITLLREENFRTSELTYEDYIDLIKYFCIRIKQKGYTPMIMGTADWFEQFSEGQYFDGYLKMVYDPNNPPSDINNCIIWIYRANSKNLINGIENNLVVAISVGAYIDENEH